jgi:hypothetical protein
LTGEGRKQLANARRPYSEAETLALLTQVSGRCPLCENTLFYKKKSRNHKGYELAHIYPLNPTAAEIAELSGVRMLSSDVNDPDNIIPLCLSCHGKFDKPRTREEYDELYAIKFDAIRADRHRSLAAKYPLENEISGIVALLHADVSDDATQPSLVLDAKTLDQKLNSTMPVPTRRKVRNAVEDYFRVVQRAFLELERDDPGCSALIFGQVRAFYLMQKHLNLTQAEIFANIVRWIQERSDAQTLESAEAIASFFIQNCEVFE